MTMCFKTIERCQYIQVIPQTKKRGSTDICKCGKKKSMYGLVQHTKTLILM